MIDIIFNKSVVVKSYELLPGCVEASSITPRDVLAQESLSRGNN